MKPYLEFSPDEVLLIVAGVFVLVAALVAGMRAVMRRKTGQTQVLRTGEHPGDGLLRSRTKYSSIDVMQYRPIILLVGLATSLVLTTAFLNLTLSDKQVQYTDQVLAVDFDIEVTPPQTMEPPPPPPPPPMPQVVEVPDEMIEETEESLEFIDQSIDETSLVEAPPVPVETKQAFTPPPPPPPPPKEDVEEIFKVVEEMPRFPGCEDLATTSEKKQCAERALLEFIQTNLKYPAVARENNIQGNVVIQFVVNKDGTIQDLQLLRDIGGGCGDEVIRVVSMMNEKHLRWTPGRQRGVPVRVSFILPVRFALFNS